MTPGSTQRDYKTSLEGSSSSQASFGLMGVGINQNFTGNIYIAGH